MGTLRGDNGGERPHEGGGLPDLPPEWGTVIIPDDAAALDDEGTAVRRQFRREAIRRRWRRWLHLPAKPMRRIDEDSPGLAVPLLIMSIAIVATLVSLFAVAWPGQQHNRTGPRATPGPSVAAISLAQVGLTDANETPVRLRDVAPAVIMLVEGCSCETFIAATVLAVAETAPPSPAFSTGGPSAFPSGASAPARPGVSVIVVSTTVPALPAGLTPGIQVRPLADPNHSLRAAVPALANDRDSAVVLVTREGTVLRSLPSVKSVADFRNDLPQLW